MRNETSERTSRQSGWCWARGALRGTGLCGAVVTLCSAAALCSAVACQTSTASESRGQELRVQTATSEEVPKPSVAAVEQPAGAAVTTPAPVSAPAPVAAAAAAPEGAAASAKASGHASATAAAGAATPAADAPDGKPATGKLTEGIAASSEAFSTWLQASAPAKAGAPVQLEVVLTAKPPYHCNAEYPHKFKLNAAPGLSFPDETVKGMRVTPERSVLAVPLTATSPGKANISGTLSFSVCTEERCLVEKRDLSLALEVQ
jgi:hypothetical protein